MNCNGAEESMTTPDESDDRIDNKPEDDSVVKAGEQFKLVDSQGEPRAHHHRSLMSPAKAHRPPFL